MKPITWYKSLSDQKARRAAGRFIVEGRRGVDQLLTSHRSHIVELLCVDNGIDGGGGEGGVAEVVVKSSDIPIRLISPANMKTISSTRTPQSVAAVVRMPEDVYAHNIPPSSHNIILLEDVQDPGNVGTLIRAAAAFGYGGAVMSGKCADPFSPKVVQSTAGSLLSLWIRRSDRYIEMAGELKSRGYGLIAADLDGRDIREVSSIDNHITPVIKCRTCAVRRPHARVQSSGGAGATFNCRTNSPHVLILGNEGAGLSKDILDMCDLRIRIPIDPAAAESLNVAVSGGILMFALKCQ